jgi:outer membrane protein OmpA-like peptidoglycan-associated protein
VVTEETARSATEEVDEDDDGNDLWKYLGAAAGGAVVGALVPALGGRLVQDQGDRVVVERGGEFYVRKDENQLLRRPGARVQTETFDGGITRETVTREDGSQVVTVRNQGGFILRRTRITPDGQEIVLLEQTPEELYNYADWNDRLPPATAHRAGTIDYGSAEPEALREALVAQPEFELERSFPLQAVRESERVRGLVPAVDLPINFATGSAAIRPSEVEELTALGRMIAEVIAENPREIFLVEGHTDAVGTNVTNLALSDRRAESVALALTEYFDVPPENLVVQGYGERFLKVQTEGPSEENRRATVRRITPLIERVAAR